MAQIQQEHRAQREEIRQSVESKYGQEGLEIHDELMRIGDEIARLSISIERRTSELNSISGIIEDFGETEGATEVDLDRLRSEIESMEIALDALQQELEIKQTEWDRIEN
jgi:chromosome segregation ATPase